MIQQLLTEIIEKIRDGLAPPFSNDRIVDGPTDAPSSGQTPIIAVYADKLEIDQASLDVSSSEPRPEEFRENMPVDAQNPLGPYPLIKTPLQTASVFCKAIFSPNTLEEYSRLLIEGKDKDFTVDYQANPVSITFNSKLDPQTGEETHIITKADQVHFRYSFVGVFTLQEFRQDFLIDVYGANILEAEKWAALATAVVLTRHDEIKENFNSPDLAGHAVSTYSLKSRISNIRFLQSAPDFSGGDFKLQLRFRTQGQLKFIQSEVGGYGIISEIRSPGKAGVPGSVEIDIGLE